MRTLFGFAALFCFTFPALASTQKIDEIQAPFLQRATPLVFEPAQEDGRHQTRMQSRAGRHGLTFDEHGLQIGPARPGEAPLAITFAGARPSQPIGIDIQASRTNYLLGNDPALWRLGITNFARVVYRDLYPGVDALFYGNGVALEHDFVVAPGADYHQIRLRFSPGAHLSLDKAGALHISAGIEDLRLEKPFIYQRRGGKRDPRHGAFELLANGEVGFSVGPYDRQRPLVIDPVLSFATYLSDGAGAANAVATDAAGDTYITGVANIPVTPGAFTSCSGCGGYNTVTFVSKLSPDGTKLLYSTVLGGNSGAQPPGSRSMPPETSSSAARQAQPTFP